LTKLDHFFIIFVWLILSGLVVANACENISNRGEKGEMSTKSIEEVLKEHTRDLMAIPGVVGTGHGLCDGKPCIKVFVIKRNPELDRKIPSELDSHLVMIEETGEFRAFPEGKESDIK
jgi:hypothetical protein